MVFSSAARLVLDSLASAGGVSVVYEDGENDPITVTATRGSTRTENVVDDVASMFARVEDFIIKAEDLDFGEGPIEPEKGHRIKFGNDVYEVNPIGSEPCYQRSDRDGYYLRIHTKLISEAG